MTKIVTKLSKKSHITYFIFFIFYLPHIPTSTFIKQKDNKIPGYCSIKINKIIADIKKELNIN